MKRSMHTIFTAFVMSCSLLFSACAPASYMVATLTQLPLAGTPPTSTPYPTSTPRPTLTATTIPTAIEAAGAGRTTTPGSDNITVEAAGTGEFTLTVSPAEPSSTNAACPPFTFDTDLPDPETPEQYIGRHYDSVNPPEGISGWSAGLLEDDTFSWAQVSIQNRDVYWIQKIVCRDSGGKAYWEIVDVLVFPKLSTNVGEVSTDLCFYEEKKLPFVIALGTYDPSKPSAPVVNNFVGWPIQVKEAWEMKEKFMPLETQDLICMVQEPQNSN